MKNIGYLVGAIIGMVFLFAIGTCKVNAADLNDEVFNSSVQIGDYCSGEIIYSDRDKITGKVTTIVLTAKHCVLGDENKALTVNKNIYDSSNRQTKRDSYLATVLGTSYKSDLALLKLRDTDHVYGMVAQVAPSDVKLTFGQDVVVVGYPLGRSMTYTKGNLGYVEDGVFKDVSQSGQFYRATPDIAGGSSGSSMFTIVDGEYKIIGVVTGGATIGTFFNFFTPVEEINEYLNVAKKAYEVNQ